MYSQEKAVIDFRQGMSRKNILKKYGEHGVFLVDMYKKTEPGLITLEPSTQLLSYDNLKVKIIKDYKNGKSLKQISIDYGEFGSWVIKCYKREMIEVSSRYRLSNNF